MNEANVKEITNCRICNSTDLTEIFSLGEMKINCFVDEPDQDKGSAPLTLVRCGECDLIQLTHTVRENDLYDNYWYLSRLNKKIVDNLKGIVKTVTEEVTINHGDVVLDIGANDGTLLSFYDNPAFTIGVDPASNIQKALQENCNLAIHGFFNKESYEELSGKGPVRKAKIITAIAMFYDLDDPNTFVQDVKAILADDGLFMCQLMPARPMFDTNDVGNIIHEHLEYYTYKSLAYLFERNGLEIYKVVENDINGGSYQLFVRHFIDGSVKFNEDCSNEKIEEWIKWMEWNRINTMTHLEVMKMQGKNVYIMGASTKGNTIMQYYGITSEHVKGAAEIHPDKIGKYLVGSGIPIVHEDEARKDADVFLVFPFHFKEIFIDRNKDWIKDGGELVFCTPRFEVIKAGDI